MHLWRPPRITRTISDGYSAAPCMMAKAVALGIKGPHTSYAHRFCCLQTPTMLPLPPLCYLKALKCYLAPKGNTRKHCIKPDVSLHKPLKTIRFRGFFHFLRKTICSLWGAEMNGIHQAVHIEKQDDFRTMHSSPPPEGVFRIRGVHCPA